MAKRKLYHIGRTLRNRIAPVKGQARPVASRRMTRMEAASRSFRASAPGIPRIAYAGPSVSEWSSYSFRNLARAHRCKQSRRPLHARDGRNVLTPSNEGRPERRVSVSRPRSRRRSSDFPADQTSGRERRFPFYARALHPRRYGHERGRCLDLRALDPVEAHSSKPCVRSLKLVALCGPGRWQKTARGRGASGLCWVGI